METKSVTMRYPLETISISDSYSILENVKELIPNFLKFTKRDNICDRIIKNQILKRCSTITNKAIRDHLLSDEIVEHTIKLIREKYEFKMNKTLVKSWWKDKDGVTYKDISYIRYKYLEDYIDIISEDYILIYSSETLATINEFRFMLDDHYSLTGSYIPNESSIEISYLINL